MGNRASNRVEVAHASIKAALEKYLLWEYFDYYFKDRHLVQTLCKEQQPIRLSAGSLRK
jgi:hypothetical protein